MVSMVPTDHRLSSRRRCLMAVAVAIIGLMPTPAGVALAEAEQWPMFRRDVQGSAVTPQTLALPLREAWRYTSVAAPSPAWPSPVPKGQNPLEFDHAPQPVVAGGMAFFASSSDDTIRALDARTGQLRWEFVTGGPVRFAPSFYDGRLYAGGDDGVVYCLKADTGELLWSFHAALSEDRLLGDGRMISRWPLRCNVLVADGVVYAVAGMWPSEGVFIYALDAASGQVIWVNDTAGEVSIYDVPVTGRMSIWFGSWTGVAPQGVMFASQSELVVPTGRTDPVRIDRVTGRLLSFSPGAKQNLTAGPAFAMVGNAGWKYAHGGATSGSESKQSARTGDNYQAWGGGHRFRDLPQPSGTGSPNGMDVTLLVTADRFYARRGYSIALAGETLLVGEDGAVAAYEALETAPASRGGPARYDAQTQREIWRAPVNGQARGLAVAYGRVYVTTDRGEIYCFAAADEQAPAIHHQPRSRLAAPQPPDPDTARLIQQIHAAGMHKGYVLVVGDASGELSIALASHSELSVINIAGDEAATQQLRERLLAQTALHGSSVHVFAAPADGRLPFARFFANAVIVSGDPGPVPPRELYRVLRPGGGLLLAPGLPPAQALAALRQAAAAEAEIGHSPAPHLVRRPLPEALDWSASRRTDAHLRGPLRPLWFGGGRPLDAYSRTTNDMTAAAGRFFHLVGDRLFAMDGYNGVELWRCDVPGHVRRMTADDRSVYLVLDGPEAADSAAVVQTIDAATGVWRGEPVPLASVLDRLPPRPASYGPDPDVASALRVHPLTGDLGPRMYRRDIGCGSINSSAFLMYTRSNTLGLMDLLDDSGIRHFGGVRPSCGTGNVMTSGGVLFVGNEHIGCVCLFSLGDATFALAQAETRLHEDWAYYTDVPASEGRVRMGSINLGAPGDRRDDAGTLWLGYPPVQEGRHGTTIYTPGGSRPTLVTSSRQMFNGWWPGRSAGVTRVPLTVQTVPELGPWRVNADRVPVAATDRPWIYSSQYRGLTKLTWQVDGFGPPLVSAAAAQPPTIDGLLDEPAWTGEPQIELPNTQTQVLLRHDDQAIYLAMRSPARFDRLGELEPWLATTSGQQARVWLDDSIEVFFSDAAEAQVVHLGVSASGARYMATALPHQTAAPPAEQAWHSAATADEQAFVVELAVPLSTLRNAGLDLNTLSINVNRNERSVGSDTISLHGPTRAEAIRYLGGRGRDHLPGVNCVPLGLGATPEPIERSFTVWLHFAELDDAAPGQRVFDVKLQGQAVARHLDVVRDAGGPRVALVREFANIMVGQTLVVELVTANASPDAATAPILAGIELRQDGFSPPSPREWKTAAKEHRP